MSYPSKSCTANGSLNRMSAQADIEEIGRNGAVERTRRTEERRNIGDIGPIGKGQERRMSFTSIRGDIVRYRKPQCRGRRDTWHTSLELYSSHVVTTSQPICAGLYGPSTIKSHIVTTFIAPTIIVLKTTSTPDTSRPPPTGSLPSMLLTPSRRQTNRAAISIPLPPSGDQ